MDVRKTKKTIKRHEQVEPILKKHVGLIHCENKLTLVQRKICNILLFNALDRIKEDEIHEISLRQLCSLVGYRSNDISLIKRALKSLISIVLEWNLLDDSKFIDESNLPADKIAWYASSLLAGASIERGQIRYSYSPQIKTVLSSLEIYGRINLFVQAKFNSTYSLVLYENCVRFKNIGRTTSFALPLFRSLMGLAPTKYKSFKELNRNVVQVAMQEINAKSDITIEVELKRSGRQVTGLQFYIAENENYKPAFKRIEKMTQQPSTEEQRIKLTHQATANEVLINEFGLSAAQTQEVTRCYTPEYIFDKIKWVKQQKHIKNLSAYLIAALKHDYKAETKKASLSVSPPVETPFLRELKEASQISSLRKKYMEYKFEHYRKSLVEQPEVVQAEVQMEFLAILNKNPHVLTLYKRHKFKSPFVMAEFIKFIDLHYQSLMETTVSFDEFITSEEDEYATSPNDSTVV